MLRVWIVLLCSVLCSPVYAVALPKTLHDGLQHLNDLQGFSCKFQQIVHFGAGDEEHYTGSLAVRKPNLFRWLYEKPYQQLYIGDGQVIWHYEPDLMQVQVLARLDDIDPVLMRILAGRLLLSEVQVLQADEGLRQYKVLLAGKTEVSLGFSADGQLQSLLRQDAFGNRNEIRLLSIDRSLPKRQLFRFTPPKGVDVVRP